MLIGDQPGRLESGGTTRSCRNGLRSGWHEQCSRVPVTLGLPDLGVESPWPLAAISIASKGARIICVPITAKQRCYRGPLLRTT